MPVNTSGGYTPLTIAERQMAADIATNYLIHNPGASNLDVAIRVGKDIHIDQSDQLVLFNIFGDVRDDLGEGTLMSASPTYTPDPDSIPTLPSDPVYRGMVITDYVVIITNPTTGDRTTSRETITSTDPLSTADILATINADRAAYLRAVSPMVVGGTPFDGLEIDIIPIGVHLGG